MAVLNSYTSFAKRPGRRSFAIVMVLFMFFLPKSNLPGQTISKEYQIKAAFLFNFAQFVDWPPNALDNASTPMVIGILGDDPFGGFLDETVRGEKVNGHPLIVQRYQQVQEATNCEILYISHSEKDQLTDILARLKAHALLTVGDIPGFSKAGGIIRFSTVENKIHLIINLTAAREAHLTVSSKLLRLAEVIEPGKD